MPAAPPEYVNELDKRGFALSEFIGSGAYGTVYKAIQRTLDRAVAVKFFDTRGMRSAANHKRFKREGALLATVQHPAVPYVITTGEVKGLPESIPYTVMQYVSGKRLDEVIGSGRVPLDVVRGVMKDVLSALDCAHRLGVIHRDVKPDNIVVSQHGTYLLDFSVGFCLDAKPGLSRATEVGDKVGTWLYAAPEQAQDSSSVRASADIYSAGVVLAEMLGARVPLRHDRLDADLSTLSAEVRSAIRRATADAPEQRFSSAATFWLALESLFGPTGTALLEKRVVLCPGRRCSRAAWSNDGQGKYYRGPSIVGPTRDLACGACGSTYIRGCPSCGRPLPEDISDLVVKKSKASQLDPTTAYCSACTTLIFETPTCKKCRSYLSKRDMDADTAKVGCEKCRSKDPQRAYRGYRGSSTAPEADAPPYSPDDDIPF